MGNDQSAEVEKARREAYDEKTKREEEEKKLRIANEKEAARLRAEEEKLVSEQQLLEDLRLKRKKLLDSFNSQKYLMIGAPGAGKSSFINSFNYVMNLIFDEDVDYEEVAEVGGGRGFSKTQMFEEFSAELDEGMYSKMTDEEMRAKAPAFFDVAGIPNQSKYSTLIQAMAQGKVEDDTAINPLLEADSEELGRQLGKGSKEFMSWGIMFVVPLTELAEDGVPEALANGLAEATVELAKLRCEIRIFVIITKVDLLPKEDAEEKLKPFIESLKNSVNIEENRIFKITNFTPSDRRKDYTMQPIKSKQIEFLDAFNQILQYKPRFMRKKKRRADKASSPPLPEAESLT